MADGAPVPAELQVKRRVYFISAGMLLLGFLVHRLLPGHLDPRLALIQLGWSLCLVLLGMAVGAGVMAPWVSGMVASVVCLASVTAIIHFTGGPASPYFSLLVSVPLLLTMFTPDSRLPTLLALGAALGAQVMLGELAGMPMETLLKQTTAFGLVGVLGLFGGRTYRRLREAERVAQEERLRALEQLAESERQRLHSERERVEMERLVVVGQLAAGVAHEVNNPLAFVKSNLGYLKRELMNEDVPPDKEELDDLLSETEEGVLRIEQIVAELRRFSRRDEPLDPRGQLQEAMEEARRLASMRLRGAGHVVLDASPGLPSVRLGQRYLVQVLVNLLLNAADAVEEAVPSRPARIQVRARAMDGGIRLEVEDNGPGIPPAMLSRIFDPFFTTKAPGKGTGLGLALCREYVSRAGGTLTAENRPEGGARFVVTLREASESPREAQHQ